MISVGIQNEGGKSDNIKKEILISCPVVPSKSTFANIINSLDPFTISATDIPTFKTVSNDLSPITYYIELLNLGKGIYGTGGIVLTESNIKITSFGSNSKDIAALSTTQIIDLGYTGVSVVDALNSQIPAIVVQDQNDGYALVSGNFEEGIYKEYLWIGSTGVYGGGGALQATTADLKELSGDISNSSDQNNFSRVILIGPNNLSGNGSIESQICDYINALGYTKKDFDADVWIEYDSELVETPINCVVSAWSDWSECRLDGTQTRTRTVITPASNGGAFCPVLFENRACNYVPAPDPDPVPAPMTNKYFLSTGANTSAAAKLLNSYAHTVYTAFADAIIVYGVNVFTDENLTVPFVGSGQWHSFSTISHTAVGTVKISNSGTVLDSTLN